MTPDDVATVQRSWGQLRGERVRLVEVLTHRLEDAAVAADVAGARASWIVDAADELVGLLSSPSRLGGRVRTLADTWPDPLVAPSLAVDGAAWLLAAAECSPEWWPSTERAWRHAWLLLADVLASEALSPFTHPSA
jgi:hypothetical protein